MLAARGIIRRYLAANQVYVSKLSRNVQERDILKHRVFEGAVSVQLFDTLNKTSGNIMHRNGVVTFNTPDEKERCLDESHYFSGNSFHHATILPVHENDFFMNERAINERKFFRVYPHGILDSCIVNNIPTGIKEEDMMGVDLDGLVECRIFANAEKQKSKNPKDMQFGLFFFENANKCNQFVSECFKKEHVINDQELKAISTARTPAFVGSE